MQEIRPYVLTIGGFDTSAGAGVLADIKTFEQLGVLGMAVLTANTVQTEESFFALRWERLEDVLFGVQKMMNTYQIDFVKIGIMPNSEFLDQVVNEILEVHPKAKIIWDPVLKSSSGYDFFTIERLNELRQVLSKLYLLTPNFVEYSILQEHGLLDAAIIQSCAVLQKGGHRSDDVGLDVLTVDCTSFLFKVKDKVKYAKHGSGCVLSSAIVAYLSLGLSLQQSCEYAKEYTAQFLNSNSSLLGFHYEQTR